MDTSIHVATKQMKRVFAILFYACATIFLLVFSSITDDYNYLSISHLEYMKWVGVSL